MSGREWTVWEHLNELFSRVKKSLATILIGTIVAATVPWSLSSTDSSQRLVDLPYEPLVSRLLVRIQNDLLPPDVPLYVGPFDLIWVFFLGALALGFTLASPFVALQINRFIAPALYTHEKHTSLWVIGPLVGLFLSGASFTYLFVLPFSYRFLFGLVPPNSRLQIFFPITEFYSISFLMMIGIGLVFTFPVFTTLLIRLGVFTASDLAGRWREVLLGMIAFSAIITPDGTGVTMAFLAVPLLALFGVALVAGKLVQRVKTPIETPPHTTFN